MRQIVDIFEAIRPGYPLDIRLQFPADFWSSEHLASGRLVAQFRSSVPDVMLVALNSDGGTIEREPDETLLFHLSAEATAGMDQSTYVVFDIVRTMGGESRAVPGRVSWPVKRTVTRNVE